MNRFSHGGDIYSRRIEHDFSANINPLGIPGEVVQAASRALRECSNYPDPCCRALAEALSRREGIPPERIVCGNGAADLIYRIVSALNPRCALLCAPTFSEYEKALTEHGCAIRKHMLNRGNGFALTEGILGDIAPGTDILFLCTPNNPTGVTIPAALLRQISGKCRESGTFLVVDECFLDFVEGGNMLSAKPLLNENSAVLKAFTKSYAIFGSERTAARVAESGQTWNVSVPAQAAGIAALELDGYVEKTVELISTERRFLSAGLRALGLKVIPSAANFILFRCDVPLDELLPEHGLMVRNCENYDGLGKGWFRTAVRLRKENELLLAALMEVLHG